MEKLGQEPAYPCTVTLPPIGALPEKEITHHGISKRFYAACCAMQGILANQDFLLKSAKYSVKKGLQPDEFLIKTSYGLADELLKQENE